jgi:hypothetical protein
MHYRKIYESHNGPIPTDEFGRTYDIHHLDGNHANDSIENLKALTIREHYDIHYDRGDWYACVLIGDKMKIAPEEASRLASLAAQKRVESGTHNFQKREDGTSLTSDRVENGTHNLLGGVNARKRVNNGSHHFLDSEKARERNMKLIAAGTHHLLGGELQRKTNKKLLAEGKHHFQKRQDGTSIASDKAKNGTNPFLGAGLSRKLLATGTHPSQKLWKCEHCSKEGHGTGAYSRWHGDNCKSS